MPAQSLACLARIPYQRLVLGAAAKLGIDEDMLTMVETSHREG
jgi:hypothetical protein